MEAGKRAKGPSRLRATKNATISTKRNPSSDKFSFAKDPFQPSHNDLCDLNIGPSFTMFAQAADPIDRRRTQDDKPGFLYNPRLWANLQNFHQCNIPFN
jgi:hypothetical protein